ncbi:MAG: ribonuclease HII [Mycoplasmoidaceae bacterium]|nr:ribonuclease HII [Mycoplasmoidaceae bacterium]
MPVGYENKAIKDSKVLSIKKREELAQIIKDNCVAYAIAYVDAPRIDIINIKEAAKEAMVKALHNLKVKPTVVLVDAEEIKYERSIIVPIIKGDAKSTSIAAASILAKVYRDKILDDLSQQYPQYGFAKNKGYGTMVHLNALKRYGPIKSVHRFSYKPVKEVTKNT